MYVDTCIYLNLWKREEPFVESAKRFFEKCAEENTAIYVSALVLKELERNVPPDVFEEKIRVFSEDNFVIVKATPEDYAHARKIARAARFSISFFDCMHVAIAQRLRTTLVTHDKRLIRIAASYCDVATPDQLAH